MISKDTKTLAAKIYCRLKDVRKDLSSTLVGVDKWQILRIIFFIVFFLGSIALRFVMSFPVDRNSDDANNFLAGLEMAAGNWRLHGWVLAPDNFFTTDIFGEALLIKIFGVHPYLMQLLSAIIWSLVIFVGIILSSKKTRKSVVAIIAITTMLALTIPAGQGVMSFTTRVASHAFSILLGLLTFWLIARMTERQYRIFSLQSLCLVLLVFAGSFADPIYIVMSCLPALVVFFVRPIKFRSNRNLIIACMLIGILSARYCLKGVAIHGGFDSSSLTISFAGSSEIIDRTRFAFLSIIKLFGADFSGMVINKSFYNGPYIYLLRLPFFLAFILVVIDAGLKFLRFMYFWPSEIKEDLETDFLDQVLFLSVVLSMSAVIVTTASSDPTAVRYFIPSFVTGAILVTRRYSSLPIFSLYTATAFVGSLIFVVHVIHSGPKKAIVANESIMALNGTLRSLDLHHGYAGYWQSSILSAVSKRDAQVLALVGGGGGYLQVFPWFANLDWYRDAATNWRGKIFFIARDSNSDGLDLSQNLVIEQFGSPDQIVHSGPFLIDIYDNQHGTMKLPMP